MNRDLAGAGEALGWIADVMWGDLQGVSVSMPPSARRGDGSGSERYLVVPSARHPRMLLPALPAAAAAALAAGNAMRRPGARTQRRAAGLIVRAGVAPLIFRDIIEVRVASEGPSLSAIFEELFHEPVVMAINVRPAGPYRKPVVQVLTPEGRTLAYAKIAWNDVTERNVAAEADALDAASTSDLEVSTPRVHARLAWRGHTVLVTDPMPGILKGYPVAAGPPAEAVTRSVANLWPGERAVLAESPYRSSLAERIAGAATHAPEITEAALDALARADARFGDVELDHRGWHGDWAPWNMGVADGRLWVWDWEYARAGVPLGFDLPQWQFQRSFIERRSSFSDGLLAARAAASGLIALGLQNTEVEATLALHALEVTARYLDAMVLGAAPNPRFVTGSAAALATIPPGHARG